MDPSENVKQQNHLRKIRGLKGAVEGNQGPRFLDVMDIGEDLLDCDTIWV